MVRTLMDRLGLWLLTYPWVMLLAILVIGGVMVIFPTRQARDRRASSERLRAHVPRRDGGR